MKHIKSSDEDLAKRLEALKIAFNPRSIAFIGASNNLAKWGFMVLHHLLIGGYTGKIYPVNPKEDTIMGIKAYPSIKEIPDEIDLAIFTIPAQFMPNVITECVEKKVKAGLVIPAGFSEQSEEGEKIETDMLRRARAGNMILIGPNCQGISNPSVNLNPWMPSYIPAAGPISIVSQSGNILTWLAQGLEHHGFGIAKGISAGNSIDLGFEEYLTFLENDPDTRVIILYVEGISGGKRFLDTARRVNQKKPIIILKAGGSESGARAAQSHTGTIAGNEEIFQGVCRQAGLIRVKTLQEAVCVSAGLASIPLPKGNRLAIITTGGGLGVMSADMCAEYDISIPELSTETAEKLRKILPPWWVPGNPIDMVAGVGYATPDDIISIIIDSGEFDSVLFIGLGWFHTMIDLEKKSPLHPKIPMDKIMEVIRQMDNKYCQNFIRIIKENDFPILINSQVAERALDNNYESLVRMIRKGIMLFPSIEMAILELASSIRYGEFRQRND